MKIISIGDLHGHGGWKEIAPYIDHFDKIIFVADYVDSKTLSNEQILNNLLEVIEFKKKSPEKVELLLGNHDVQYMFYGQYRCDGFRADMVVLEQVFKENSKLFKVAYQYENYLWTHAGLTNKFWAELQEEIKQKGVDFSASFNYADVLNACNESSLRNKVYQTSGMRLKPQTNKAGGILWADAAETTFDFITGLNQIVGHTPVSSIMTVKNKDVEKGGSVTYIDCLHNQLKFYELDIE